MIAHPVAGSPRGYSAPSKFGRGPPLIALTGSDGNRAADRSGAIASTSTGNRVSPATARQSFDISIAQRCADQSFRSAIPFRDHVQHLSDCILSHVVHRLVFSEKGLIGRGCLRFRVEGEQVVAGGA